MARWPDTHTESFSADRLVNRFTGGARKAALQVAAETAALFVSAVAPVKTGELSESIEGVAIARGPDPRIEIEMAGHGLFVEHGTSKQYANPFTRTTVRATRRAWEAAGWAAGVAYELGQRRGK